MSDQKNFGEQKLEVLRNLGIKDDDSTTVETLLDDIGIWLNNRYKDIRKKNVWPELRAEANVIVPANTSEFSKPSSLKTIITIRNGTTVLHPVDPAQVNDMNPAAWTETGEPRGYIQRGENGIRLLGKYATATTLSLYGKSVVSELTNDNDIPDIDIDDVIIAGATADGFSIARPIETKLRYWTARFDQLLELALNEARQHQADEQCVRPRNAWTGEISYGPSLSDGSNFKVPLI